MRFTLRTTAFSPGGRIPTRHTADGANLSPPLAWEGAPSVTRSFALVCGAPQPSVPGVAEQGLNDFGRVGWGGPAPPLGQDHRYVFELYALESRLDLPARATRAQLAAEMEGRVRAHATSTGHYGRGAAAMPAPSGAGRR